MDEGIKLFVGLDVHKDSIAVAVAEEGRTPGRQIGVIAHNVAKLLKLLQRYGEPKQVQVVYEAGPTGYGLQRMLAQQGYQCQVIAPALIPKRAEDCPPHRFTDRFVGSSATRSSFPPASPAFVLTAVRIAARLATPWGEQAATLVQHKRHCFQS